IAMLTPAQKPRGLARMILTQVSFFDILILPRSGGPAKQPAGKQHRHPGTGWRWLSGSNDLASSRRRYFFSSFFSNSTLVTVMTFLPSFSATVPVTLPLVGVLQIFW